jgi:hypothetical protein
VLAQLHHFDRRPHRPAIYLAGFTGNNRLPPAMPVRDHRGIDRNLRSFALDRQQEHANLQGVYGSDGTRTRDLRRDRPVLVFPGSAGVGGDYWREQGFSTLALRG